MERPTRDPIATRIYLPGPAVASFRLAAPAAALADEGAEVTVVTASVPDAAGAAPDRPGVRVRRRPVLRDASGYVRGYLPCLSLDVPLLLRPLGRRRPDVVVADPPPTTGAELGAARTAVVRHGVDARVSREAWSHVLRDVNRARLVLLGRGTMHARLARRAEGVWSGAPPTASGARSRGRSPSLYPPPSASAWRPGARRTSQAARADARVGAPRTFGARPRGVAP